PVRTASVFLARQGVRATLVERHPGTSIYPRARGVNGRTMELLRGLGLEERVRRVGEALSTSVGIHSGRSLVEVIEPKKRNSWFFRKMRERAAQGRVSSK